MKNLFAFGVQVLKRFGKTNASTILSVASSIGTVAAVVLCGEATVKAVRLVEEKQPEGTVEMVKTVAPVYAPTVAATALSIACGFKSNDISKKKTAALTTLLNLSESMANDYREKVVETIGEQKEREIRDQVAREKAEKQANQVAVMSRESHEGESLFFDAYSGRYFWSTHERIMKAFNDVNYKILGSFYASLNDYYEALDNPKLTPNTMGDEVGWGSPTKVEPYITTGMREDGIPYGIIDFDIDSKPRTRFDVL